jgi:hypothetical protein
MRLIQGGEMAKTALTIPDEKTIYTGGSDKVVL